VLLRYQRKHELPELERATVQLRDGLRQVRALAAPSEISPDDRMHGLGPLLGLEGGGSAAYFGVLGTLLREPWRFGGRVKRPPTDPVNALLSFGYTVLANQIVSLLCVVGLNPYLGMLHRPGYGKPALALDLLEEFRPVVVDSVVISLVNTGQLSPSDFDEELGAYRLKDAPRKLFLHKLEERLNEVIQHPLFGYRVSYRRCIELQARLLAKWLLGEVAHYVPFLVR
jgi:CRISP-associated protein Cas1